MKRARILLQLLFAALFTMLLLASGPLPGVRSAELSGRDPIPFPKWRNEVVAPGVTFYTLGAPSFALDPDGYPHIAYGQNRLFHTWFDGAEWHSETVDAAHAWHRESVLAIDAAGVITISDIRNGRVFARTLEPGGSWQTAEIPLPELGTADYLSIALDSGGRPHLVAGPEVYNGRALFVYAHKTAQGWTAEPVATEYPAGGPFSIALDSQDRPAILYGQHDVAGDTSQLQIASRKVPRLGNDSWQHEPIATGCLIGSKALALDGQDRAHVVFSESCDESLTYTRQQDSGWETKLVTYSGVDPGLALDSAGRPHVVYGDTLYWDTVRERQVYAALTGTGWKETIVQEGVAAGRFNTLVLDNRGTAHIVSLAANLQYATNNSGRWLVSTPAVQEIVGYRNALDLDPAGVPHILYHNSATRELLLSSGGANGWQTELVTKVSPADLDVAVAVDARSGIHIAYVDGERDRLVVGLRQSGEWSLEAIAAGGQHLSLAVGSDNAAIGEPHLILDQEGTVVYWTKQGDVWISEAVSEPDSAILNARLTLDSENRPHVVYSGETGSVYAVRQSPGSWVKESLPFESIDDLALGPDDALYLLHTVYVEEEIGGRYPPIYYDELRLAERSGQGWAEEALWTDAGQARLAVDGHNRVHVAFGDYLLRREGGDWLFEFPVFSSMGDVDLVLGQDNEPRMVTHDGSSLVLSTREIVWLDKFSLMPVVAR